MNSYSMLNSQLMVCGKTYRNRIGASPLGKLILDKQGNIIESEVENFAARAAGGCGVVIVGECAVDNEHSQREDDTPIIFDINDKILLEKISRYPKAIHEKGAIALSEINHCGQSKLGRGCSDKIALGPMSWEQEDGIHNVAMDEAMMEHVADNFARCAAFMKAAGFDGVVVLCGHGWLLHQFLSPRTNQRTDKYGGSLENRARFPLMVLKRIRDAVGTDFIIEPRVSGNEETEIGLHLPECAEFCKMVCDAGLADVIQVSQGIYRDPVFSREFSSMYHDAACNSMNAKYIKSMVNVPLSCVGGINSPEIAERILEEGRCDIVLLGREMFADPDFGNKVMSGNADEVNHCVRCFKCFPGPHEEIEPKPGAEVMGVMPCINCTVNPMFTRTPDKCQKPETVSRRVLVIGGGVGGMQAAIAAADCGHNVTLLEKTDRLGGILKFCDTDVHKSELRFFREQLGRKMERRGVKVLLNTEAGDDFVQKYNPEYIICAVGSYPIVLPIPGIENAVHALQAYAEPEKVGKRVVMIGGGLSGCETALNLADQGRTVTIVEQLDTLAKEGENLHRRMLLKLLADKTTCMTSTTCLSIEPGAVHVRTADGAEQVLACDTIVYAVGMRSNTKIVDTLRLAAGSVPFVTVGDCKKVQQAAQAGFDAYTEAFKI